MKDVLFDVNHIVRKSEAKIASKSKKISIILLVNVDDLFIKLTNLMEEFIFIKL